MNYYQKKKEELRQEAIEYKRQAIEQNFSWWDINDYLHDLEPRAKKYGLLKEFRENGVI